MKTEKYIAGLLYRYQCVSVPGFGAFLSEWQSAQITESQHSFIPPRKVISFNSHIKTNDGLLANHIALQEKISYESAVAKIQSQVLFWEEKLRNKETITLENIGEFYSNSENNLVFKPNTTTNYLMDSFGLSSFNSPEIIRATSLATETSTTVETAPVFELEPVKNLKEETLEETQSVFEITPKSTQINWLKYAAAAVIATGFGTYGYKMYMDYTVEQKMLWVEKSVQEKVAQKLQEATFVLPNPMTTVDLTIEKQALKKYHVVAGAYRNEHNAKKAMKELIAQGFEAHLLKKNKSGLIPVAFASYSNLSEAENQKQKIKSKDSLDAWLLID